MPDIGRNEPCPCGSGRKYKKCCLAERRPISLVDDDSARHSAMAKLMQFAARAQFSRDAYIADLLFWDESLDGQPEDTVRSLIQSDDTLAKFNSFFVFDVDIDDGSRVVDMFLDQKAHTLSAPERAYLQRLAASHLALYEVTEVQRGEGMRLRDLLTRAEQFVVEHSGSRQVVPWDLVAARVVPDSTGTGRFEGGLYLYSAFDKDRIVRKVKRALKRFRIDNPEANLADFFRRHAHLFNHLWLELVVFRPLPQLRTPEGDEILLTTTVFRVRDEAALRAALERDVSAEAEAEGAYVWLEAAANGQRLLGRLEWDGDWLRLETHAKARAQRGRLWLESIAGEAVMYHHDSHQSVASAMAQRERDGVVGPEPSGEPEAQEILTEYLNDYYRKWLDEPIPALDGRTPREAAASRAWRSKLRDLLKAMENAGARDELRGRASYDTKWLWQELGLDDPRPR